MPRGIVRPGTKRCTQELSAGRTCQHAANCRVHQCSDGSQCIDYASAIVATHCFVHARKIVWAANERQSARVEKALERMTNGVRHEGMP